MGTFLEKENAERYMREFNTRVELCPVRIAERELMDDMYDEDEDDQPADGPDGSCFDWLDEHDTTSEYGGV